MKCECCGKLIKNELNNEHPLFKRFCEYYNETKNFAHMKVDLNRRTHIFGFRCFIAGFMLEDKIRKNNKKKYR